jgi:hypothetical protein
MVVICGCKIETAATGYDTPFPIGPAFLPIGKGVKKYFILSPFPSAAGTL